MDNQQSKMMYKKISEFIENYTKIGFQAIRYGVIPLLLVPKIIISFLVYFTTDSGADAFRLPAPMW